MHHRIRSVHALAALTTLAVLLTACSDQATPPRPTVGTSQIEGSTPDTPSDAPDTPATSAAADADVPFTIADGPSITGHGISMTIPETWTTYEPERPGLDGTTYEWAAGLPVGTEPLPAGVQFSMGLAGKGAQIDTLPMAAKELAKVSPGYKFLDEGPATVAGTQRAQFLRFEYALEFDGGTETVEQVSLFIETGPGVTSTIRFIAAVGDWEAQMKASYDSIRVTGT